MSRSQMKFDSGWIFKQEDIRIPYAVKAGRTGMPTDGPDTMQGIWLAIAYDDRPQSDWKFDDWEQVTIPHDWAVGMEYDSTGWYFGGFIKPGVGCYRKTFSVPAEYEGKKITITFDGVSKNCTLWLNGFLIGSHFSGYTSFEFDLTDYLRYGDEGENVLFMRVDATDAEGWWYEGAGIYRHVYLTVTEKVHIDRYGIFVYTEAITPNGADICVETDVFNEDCCARTLSVRTTLFDPMGKQMAVAEGTVTVAEQTRGKVKQKLFVKDPMLWDLENPNLCSAESILLMDGQEVDRLDTTFGIRTVAFTKEGFFLNGKHLLLKGTCNHQDFGGVGVALPDSIHEYKIRRLKEMGSNAYRCAHNPPAQEILEACDRLGMLVMDECRKLDTTPDGVANLESLILRDRNHPSVILWCLNNEEVLLGCKNAKRIQQHMRELTKKMDPTRMTTVAMNHGWNDNAYEECIDIVGYNYGQREDQYFKDAIAYPERLMLATETTSSLTTRGVYKSVEELGHLNNYETDLAGHCTDARKSWKDLLALPRLTGIFVWTGFDYRGEPSTAAWPCISANYGIMDICGMPKDTYYYYQTVWKDEPMIHLFPHWNHKTGETVQVRLFTNCDSFELRLNGVSLGLQTVADIHDYYDTPVVFEEGTLTAIGYKDGKEVCQKSVTTAGKAEKLTMLPYKRVLLDDGEDAVVVHVGVLDSHGVPVPEASNLIQFEIRGGAKILGVCNGDPSCHEPDRATQRSAFNGWCAVLVQSVANGGDACLTASSDGLEMAEVVFTKQ